MAHIDWLEDVRLMMRALRRGRTFYLAAVMTLAVGMAGATVMFTLIRGILLRPLPVPNEARLPISAPVCGRSFDPSSAWWSPPCCSRASGSTA